MSVHPVNVPDWSRHSLAVTHKRAVESQARRYGLSEADAEDIAEGIALAMCLEGRHAGAPDEIRARFLYRTKYALIALAEQRRVTPSVEHYAQKWAASGDGDERTTDTVYDRLGHAHLPNQIEYTYARELLRFLDKLPPNCRRVMRKVANGMTALEIAKQESADIEAVLHAIHVAREWVQDHDRWGE